MPLFCKQDSLLQNFLFNAGLPQLMSKSSLLTFEIPLLCLLHIFFPTAFFGWTSWGTKGNMWLKTLQGDSGRWRSEDCTGFVSSTESMIMCTVSHATKKVMVRDMSCYHKKNNLGCIYTYIYPLTFGMFSFHMWDGSGIPARLSRLWCVKCKRQLQQSDAEMTMNAWENCRNSDLTAEIPFTQCTHHALHYTKFYINFISFFFPSLWCMLLTFSICTG